MSTPPGLLDLTPLFASNAELDDLTLMPPDTVVPSTHEGQQEPSKQFAMGQPKIMGPEKMTQNGDASKEFEQPETQTQFTPLQEIEASSREEWLTLAQRLKAEERWGEAIAAYKQAVNEDRQPQTQKQSGQDSLKQEIAASPQSFEQLQAQAFTYGQQRQWQACIETCEQALRLQPTASLYKLLGDVSQITGQLTQAQRSYREALRLQPDFAEVYGNLGTLYAREREWQRAIECFRRALRYQPQRAAHHRALAGVWEQVGNEVEAVRCWHQVLSLEPESGQAQDYFSLGNRWVRLGEWPMAERYYREAIARDEQLTDAWHNLAEVLAYHQQWQPAREIYERILPREPQRVMSRLGYARVLTKLQDWQGAMAEYHRLAESAPEQVLAQQRFAQTLKEQGLLEEAIAVYRRALNFAPDGFELRLGFAELLSEQEQWEEALPQAEAAIALNPEVAQAHYYAGRAQVACEQWQAAIPHLEQAVRLDSQLFWARYFWGESLLALEDWQGAAAVLEAAMPLNPEYPGGYCHLGQAFLELERYSEAVQAYRQAISFGSNYLSYSLLGVALLKLKDSDGAIEVLNRGLELTPDYYKFYLLLGEAFLEKQDWQAAIEALGQAVALKPEGLEFNLQLQQLLCRLGQSQEPVKNLRQALDLNCDDPQLQLALGVVLLEGRIDLDWAEACLRQNLELQPNQPQGHFYLGKCSARQGQLDEALGFYRRSWELSQSVDCGLALGEVLQQLGRWSEAVQQYRQVLLEFGESGEALFGLGQALAASERPMEAVVEWRRAMGLGWNSPELYRCLAEALVSLERWDEAVLEWGRLLELQPGNALVRRQRALALIGLGRWSESAQEWQQYWQVAPGSGQGTVLDFRPQLGIYGEIPHHQELSLTGDLTIEFWLRLRQWPQDWTNLVGKFVSDEQNEFCLRIKDGERGQWYYGRGEGCATPLTWVPQETIPLHQWVHITCVRKFGQSGQLYINGVLQGEQDWGNESGATPTEAPVRLMVSSRLHQFSDGQLSELRIWKVARTGDEIRGRMCEPLTEGEPGLVAVWSGSEDGGLVDLRGQYQGQMRQAAAAGTSHPRVGVCSCDVSQNGREQAYTLAQLYGSWAEVEFISCWFSQAEGQVSPANQETEIPCHTIQVEDEERFLEQALGLVLAHPYEVVHLSKPQMPNVILGLLYKLLWDARVIVDIEDEELSFIEAEAAVNCRDLPPLKNLDSQKWTEITASLAREFDQIRELNRAEAGELSVLLGCEVSRGLSLFLQRLPAVEFVLSKRVTHQVLAKFHQGVSVVILSWNGAGHLQRLLSSFFDTNTYFPIELIIIDHGSEDNTAEVVRQQAINENIRYINRGANFSFSDSCNYGASLTKYPYLLFLRNDIVFSSDVLPLAVSRLDDATIGAVGVRLDDDPSSLPKGKNPGVQHTGIEFVWNEQRGYFQPEQIRYGSLNDYLAVSATEGNFSPAVAGAFLLCRKGDFEKVGRFSTDYNYGLEDIDFCLRLGRDLQKACYCINGVSLQLQEGATRQKGDQKKHRDFQDNNHRLFKERWDFYLRNLDKSSLTSDVLLGRDDREEVSTAYPVKGKINKTQNKQCIDGWLAGIGDPKPRTALIKIDDAEFFILANNFRPDLQKNNVNLGYHSFSLFVPEKFLDDSLHEVSLYDAETNQLLDKSDCVWPPNRRFIDFQGMLKYSMTNPLITLPFREEDKRCFAFMENLANQLSQRALALQDKPLVSVIMPVFNRSKIIRESIFSVLRQTYKWLELIVIDDASTDDTVKVVSEIEDQRLKLLRLPTNQGHSFSRNEGLKIANGEIIAYLDSDNTWETRYLSAIVGAYDRLPLADAIYSGMLLYSGSNSQLFAVRYGHFHRSLLENRNYIDLNVFTHKRKLFNKIGGFNENLRRYTDYDLILKYSEVATLYSVPILLVNYFYNKDKNTVTNDSTYGQQINHVWSNMNVRYTQIISGKSNNSLKHHVTVVIPSFNAYQDIEQCINTLISNHWNDKLDIICIDNASDDARVLSFLISHANNGNIKLIENPKNMGFTYAVNQGIKAAQTKSDILILNNDAILSKSALLELQKSCYDLPHAAITVPRQVLPGGTKTIKDHVPYANPNRDCDVNLSAHHNNIANLPLFHNGKEVEISYAPFFATYIRRDIIEAIGMLDSEYGRHYRSDRVYCDLIRHVLGKKIYYIPEAIVFHKLQKSTDELRESSEKSAEFNLMFVKNQWDEKSKFTLGYCTAAWDVF
ncbi:MAG: glycosyltransferase [Phormidium sp. BM_Day4_Bin.17]|nr:glycosyltransferase [Phormidium sp. BM_Day4_Bin.17]UCJ13590.1 MAG: glycosyltransferase [Phormidium sp. PBR-2020]